MNRLIIATRGSKLALWQSEYIKARLEAHHNIEVELKIMMTKGDKILDTPLALIGGKGLFTKELQEAMLRGEAHLAVHSLKDVPTVFPKGLCLSAITKREDSRDAFLSDKYESIDALPKGAVVGTTSLRRRMQLLKYRSDLTIKDLRGNINTRMEKLKNGEFDAIILATAGIKRLGVGEEIRYIEPIAKDIMVPAMGQAALGIETIDDEKIKALVAVLNDEEALIETSIERGFVDRLNGGCQAPIGINAQLKGDEIHVRTILGLPNGEETLSKSEHIAKDAYQSYAQSLYNEMIAQGARELLERAESMAFK